MSKNVRILPKLAVGSLRRNSSIYLPYLLATSICTAIFFIFAAISENPIMETLPHAAYIVMLLMIGQVLLCIILAPFLISVNRFLIKQRKTELALYSVLGLGKKHIGLVLFIESAILYVLSSALGIVTAAVFSRLIFMFLMNIVQMPADTSFVFSIKAVSFTLVYFGLISIVNLIINLVSVSTAKPGQLFISAKGGDKQPKFMVFKAVTGVICMAIGYFIAMTAKVDASIFSNFFFAVLLVVIGTYQLFSAGSVTLLKALKRNKTFYYNKKNFSTVAGMLYRMKKNSNSLSNICIFATMAIVTVTCTFSVFFGTDGAVDFTHPYDYSVTSGWDNAEAIRTSVHDAADEYSISITDELSFNYTEGGVLIEGESWKPHLGWGGDTLNFITVDDYNRLTGDNAALNSNEMIIYCTGKTYNLTNVNLNGNEFKVKFERTESDDFDKKSVKHLDQTVYAAFDSAETIERISEEYKEEDNGGAHKSYICFNADGGDVEGFDAFLSGISGDNVHCEIKTEWSGETHAIIGGLLFLGIFFGIIFLVCVVLIMYYKQISEGYEDKRSYEIMRKVGMSDKEMRGTVSRQILLFFFLPLLAAATHTAAATGIISNLLATLQIYDTVMIYLSAAATIILFAAAYAVSYLITARAYYKIVSA